MELKKKKKKSIAAFADYFISGMLGHLKIINHLPPHQLDVFSASYAEERESQHMVPLLLQI